MKFFLRMDEEKVNSKQNSSKIEEHYAWCIQQSLNILNKSEPLPKKLTSAIAEFKKNMLSHAGTKKLFEDYNTEYSLQFFTADKPYLFNEDAVKNMITGFELPELGYICTYEDEVGIENMNNNQPSL